MIKVDWGDHEETLIVWHFDDQWYAEDYACAIHQTNLLAMTKPHTVNIIMDLRRTSTLASRLLQTILDTLPDKSPNLYLSVMITTNKAWQTLFNIITCIYRRESDVRFVDTVDAAYSLVEEKHPQIIKPKRQ